MLYKYSADRHFESMSDSKTNLRGCAMVEAQHAAEALAAFDGVDADSTRSPGSINRLSIPW